MAGKSADFSSVFYPTIQARKSWHTLQCAEAVLFLGNRNEVGNESRRTERVRNMKPRICMCCGEPLPEGENVLSRNPNVCASCSSMDDGMGESSDPELAGGGLDHPPPTKPEEGPVIKAKSGAGNP